MMVSMLRIARLVPLLVVLLAGCSQATASGASTPGEPTDTSSPPGDGSSDPGPGGSAASPGSHDPGRTLTATPLTPGDSTVLTGTLGFDTIEGGCGYLETADGKRYEVVYPAGWRVDAATGGLAGPDGRSVRPGAAISVRGAIATGMASICQIGPIFRATEVLPG